MKLILICAFVFEFVSAESIDKDARIWEQKNVPYKFKDGKGMYEFSFSTSNSMTREEKGVFIPRGENEGELVVKGSYSYVTADNKRIIVTYDADSMGYRPKIEEVQLLESVLYTGTTLLISLAGGGIR